MWRYDKEQAQHILEEFEEKKCAISPSSDYERKILDFIMKNTSIQGKKKKDNSDD